MSYARDSVGRITAITYPSGKVLGLLYNNGKVDDMTWQGNPLILDIQYFPFGGPESWLFNGNREYTRFTDLNGRTEKYLTPSGYRKLTFDNAGRITQIGDHLGQSATPSATQSFGYDNAGRLTSFNGFTSAGSQTQSFTYDNNGNRLSSVLNGAGSSYSYQAGNNKLASVTGGIARTNTYDATGNLTSNGSHTYSYDDRGRLTQAIAGGLTTTYSLNYQNLRVKKTNSQETRLFVYDEAGHMIGEYSQDGTPIQEMVWLGDTPVAVTGTLPVPCGTAGATQQGGACTLANAVGYIWADHLNTPREITVPTPTQQDAAQHTSIWKWDSLPFGETQPNENPNSLGTMTFNHRFPGQYRDSESGLYQNWHREYDPLLGRYVQSDPLGLKDGPNPFVYVGGNPISRIDRLGLSACDIIAAIDAAKLQFPDLKKPDWRFGRSSDFPNNQPAYHDPSILGRFGTGTIVVNPVHYGAEGLSEKTLLQLLEDIIHEMMHESREPVQPGHNSEGRNADPNFYQKAACMAYHTKQHFKDMRSYLDCK